MIFDRDKSYNTFYSRLIIHIAIFISISLNIFSSNSIADFIFLTCLIIYLSKESKVEWHYSLLIFFWGCYSDLVIGYPIGYSGMIFLFFLLLNQLSHFFGIFSINKIRFLIFTIGLFLVSAFEFLTIYLQFGTSMLIYSQVLKILFILFFYYPINYFIKNNFNLYAPKE